MSKLTKVTTKAMLINVSEQNIKTIDSKGNYKWHTYVKNGELIYARSNRRKNLCGELAKKVIEIAKAYGRGIAVEDLRFAHNKDVTKKFSRIKHQFIYRQLLTMIESACNHDVDKFKNKNEWSKWSEISKNIKRKVGENPALWLINRKKLLGM